MLSRCVSYGIALPGRSWHKKRDALTHHFYVLLETR